MRIPHPYLFAAQALILITIACVHVVALMNDSYWFFPILNRAIHAAGGLWVALCASWLLLLWDIRPRFIILLGAVIVVGLLWEVFEKYAGFTADTYYELDTLYDLIMDLVGGVLGYILTIRVRTHATMMHHESSETISSESHGSAA